MAIRVKAVRPGVYPPGRLRQVGETFEVPEPKHLGKWMERMDTPKGKSDKSSTNDLA